MYISLYMHSNIYEQIPLPAYIFECILSICRYTMCFLPQTLVPFAATKDIYPIYE